MRLQNNKRTAFDDECQGNGKGFVKSMQEVTVIITSLQVASLVDAIAIAAKNVIYIFIVKGKKHHKKTKSFEWVEVCQKL